jgi:hypothetical protein
VREMLNSPEDLRGKWFSNVAGKPEDYYFVLSVKLLSVARLASHHFITKYIRVEPKRVVLGQRGWDNFHMWREPIKDLITLVRVRRRAIKGMFAKRGIIE